jgi:four helix bundle protein
MQKFRTFQMAKVLYLETKKLRLRGAVRDQLERAALSIATNLAEGSGKIGEKDRRRFFQIAMGSLRETQALLEITENHEAAKLADQLGASLYQLLLNPGPGI